MDNVLTVEDVARLLKVKPITVREMLRAQRIRGFKVGKAWRTTEAMLEEDLATIAKGAKPEPLEAQRVLAAQPKRQRRGRKPAAQDTPPPAPQKRTAHTVAEEDETAARPPRRGAKGNTKPEDQQLLF